MQRDLTEEGALTWRAPKADYSFIPWLTESVFGNRCGRPGRRGCDLPDGSGLSNTYDPAHGLTAISNNLGYKIQYTLDAAGNRITDNLASYTYDARGRLVQATSSVDTTQYQINALGLRTKKSGPLGETIFVHDRQGRLIAEADGQGSIAREYVWLDDTPVVILDGPPGATQTYAMHPDPLGTPRAVTNTAGTVVWRNSPVSEPFGLLSPEQDPDNNGTPFVLNLRFPGQYFDRETNLAYNWHRYYDAQMGAYTTSDPIGLAGGQWSTYPYVGSAPTMSIDPDGLRLRGGGGRSFGSGSASQRRYDRRHSPPHPGGHEPNSAWEEAAGYYADDGQFVCLRWKCQGNPMCYPDPYDQRGQTRQATSFIPAATDPLNPPEGCVCDHPNWRKDKDPGLWGPEDWSDLAGKIWNRYGK